jgi:DNA polymerase III delta' subunit
MKPFSTITGQAQARSVLSAAVASGRLAHAYIFAGPDGSGRLTAALDLARVHICREEKNGFCGRCSHCLQISGFSHPDVRFTVPALKTTRPEEIAGLFSARASDGITPLRIPGNSYISIEQVRELEGRLSKRSFEGRGYVEIIPDAHLMRREAANAMLKTLEEPPPGTLIILITSALSSLLPTVRSRAHTVRFGRLSVEMVKKVLLDRGMDGETAGKLALCSDGCPGRALLLGMEDTADTHRADEIFTAIMEGLSPVKAALLAGDLARELGREGVLDLCSRLVSIAHDARRAAAGGGPLERESVPDTAGADDSMLESVVNSMQLCSSRIKANVSPAMALAAALGSASEIRDTQ